MSNLKSDTITATTICMDANNAPLIKEDTIGTNSFPWTTIGLKKKEWKVILLKWAPTHPPNAIPIKQVEVKQEISLFRKGNIVHAFSFGFHLFSIFYFSIIKWTTHLINLALHCKNFF